MNTKKRTIAVSSRKAVPKPPRPRPRKHKKPVAPDSPRRATRRRRAFFSILILLFFGITVTLSMTVFFFIEDIQVEGTQKYTAEQIIAAGGINLDDNMFRISAGNAEKRILSALPYVANVRVRRKLPDTIRIFVEDETPAYTIQTDDYCLLLNNTAKVLESSASSFSQYNIPRIVGLDTSEYKIGQKLSGNIENKDQIIFDILAVLLDNDILYNINTIDVSDTFKILLHYDQRLIVKLGTAQNIESKILFFMSIMDSIDDNAKGSIDVSDGQVKKGVYSASDSLRSIQ